MSDMRIRLTKPPGSTSSVAHIRGHEVVVDRPEPKGGSDAGPMGGELLLASVGGCFTSTLIAAASARGVTLAELEIEVVASVADAPTRIDRIDITVHGGPDDEPLWHHILTIAERGCLVINTMGRGTKLSVTAASPPVPHGGSDLEGR